MALLSARFIAAASLVFTCRIKRWSLLLGGAGSAMCASAVRVRAILVCVTCQVVMRGASTASCAEATGGCQYSPAADGDATSRRPLPVIAAARIIYVSLLMIHLLRGALRRSVAWLRHRQRPLTWSAHLRAHFFQSGQRESRIMRWPDMRHQMQGELTLDRQRL